MSAEMLVHIPEPLRALPQWVAWRAEERNGKTTKVPYDPKSGTHASSTNPLTWATFEEAAQAEASGRWDGIGFVFAPGGGIAGLDLDHCRDTESGVIQPWAQHIINRMASYSEISPSGAGVHIFVYGTLPPGGKHAKLIDGGPGKIELYGEKRYFSITGRPLPGVPPTVEHRQAELDAAYAEWFEQPAAASGVQPAISIHLDFTEAPTEADRTLAQRVLNEHTKILRTWMADESDGDYAFACAVMRELLQMRGLAAADEDLIRAADRAFRTSPLFERPDRQAKWTRQASNYAALTLRRAIEAVRTNIENTEPNGDDALGTENKRDYGHAKELAQHLAGRILWITEMNTWVEWTGQVWQKIPEERLLFLASTTLQRVYSKRLSAAKTFDQRKRLSQRIGEVCTQARVSGALRFLAGWPGVATRVEEFDCDPWLFNTENGTLDLRTLTLLPHSATDRMTKTAQVAYDPAARSEKWEQFLARILPDPEVRQYIKRQLGKATVGAVLEERLNVWCGGGSNGKTTLARVLMGLFGDYALRAAPNLLVASPYDRHPTELADLAGSRLVVSVEVDQGKRLAEALIKDLTGGDRKKARFMRGDFFSFAQTFDIVLIVNHRPRITGSDTGIWRRIQLVPFTVQIPESERRPQDELVEELLGEGPAILNWLLDGLRDYRSDPTWVPKAVEAATTAYRGEQDHIGQFVQDCCEQGPTYTMPAATLYEAYVEWCRMVGEDAVKQQAFGRALREHGFESGKRTGGVRFWFGLRLRKDELSKTA